MSLFGQVRGVASAAAGGSTFRGAAAGSYQLLPPSRGPWVQPSLSFPGMFEKKPPGRLFLYRSTVQNQLLDPAKRKAPKFLFSRHFVMMQAYKQRQQQQHQQQYRPHGSKSFSTLAWSPSSLLSTSSCVRCWFSTEIEHPTKHQHDSLVNLTDSMDHAGCNAHMELPAMEFAQGCSFLHQVALGNLPAVQRAIDAKPSLVNFRDYDRRTSLHIAASEGHVDICRLLIQHGARINRSDRWGGSPLDDAHRHRHAHVIDLLGQHGAVFGSPSQANNFLAAAYEGDMDEVKALLEFGHANLIHQIDYDQRTALHLAAGEGRAAIVELLCQKGANVNAVDRWGNHPLDHAQRRAKTALSKHGAAQAMLCMEILQSFGAKHCSNSILMAATSQGNNNNINTSSTSSNSALWDLMHTYGKVRKNGELSMDWHDVQNLLRGIGEDATDEVVQKLFRVADPEGLGLIDTHKFLEHAEVFLGGRPARIILVVGGPGSGKGVLCERLVKECGVVHLSSGNLLRDEVQQDTALGKHVSDIMARGELVSSAIMVTLMKKRMKDHPGKRILLDGFPRSQQNAQDLVTLCGKPELALHLNCDDTVLLERILKRGGKLKSNNNNNQSHGGNESQPPATQPPQQPTRSDDNFHTALRRIRTYHKYHQTTMDFLREQNVPIVYLDCGASSTPENVWEQLRAIGRLMRLAVQIPQSNHNNHNNDQ